MTADELIEGVKAADLGGFREVRLVTLIHQQGVTPAVRAQVAKEIQEVMDADRADQEKLRAYIKELEGAVTSLEKLSTTAKKLSELKQKATATA